MSFRRILTYFIALLAVIAIVTTLLSLFQSTSAWWLKVLDFPRVQSVLVIAACLLLLPLLLRHWNWGSGALMLGLVVAGAAQLYFVLPYTPLWSEALPDAPADAPRAATLSLLQANVLQSNRDTAVLLRTIRRLQPDVVLLEETNQWWEDALNSLTDSYPYHLRRPYPNTYGMLIFSRFALNKAQVLELQHPQVPSFHATLTLPNGRRLRLHAIHPVPPVPSQHPYNEHQKENEVNMVGQLVAADSLPTIVMGDFNDVAWSQTNRLFGTQGRLRDARIGRGLYATFDARWPFLRWPLDHVYATPPFQVGRMDRLDDIGSDHFPLYVELVLPTGAK